MTNQRPDSTDTQQVPMQAETQQTDAPATLPTSAEGQIAASLKQLYGQMLGEPMPDRFATLLSELARAERNNEGQL